MRPMLRGVAATITAVLALAVVASPGRETDRPGPLRLATSQSHSAIKVLSNRANLVSGGDALVEVVLPSNVNPSRVRVSLNGRDVTSRFAVRRPENRFLGVIRGMRLGKNEVAARWPGRTERLTITNHRIGGPVFSGPQVQPWLCETEAAGLGPAQDKQCNAPASLKFFYKNKLTGLFERYNPKTPPPPSQVATTTTDQGGTVPYVVRLETGTVNRAVYRFAVLVDPTRPVRPWGSKPWNHKLLYTFMGGAAPNHRQGMPVGSWPGYVDPSSEIDESLSLRLKDAALSRGFAVATASLNTFGQNTNSVTSAETIMMLKELITERLGLIRYTIGAGCSGGSIQQHLIAGAYPALLDGILPTCSFMDIYTTNNEATDCSLLDRVYDTVAPELWAVTQQRAVVNGHATVGPCLAWDKVFNLDQTWMDPRVGCVGGTQNPLPKIPEADYVYDPRTNPNGARCTLQDYQVAIFGRRLPQAWGPVEQRIGRGFANRPFDNVGVQYGLHAVNSGLITPEQFVSLNQSVGGYDIDGQWQPQRSVADGRALDVAYRTGQVTSGRYLARVPIIDLRGTSNNEIHTDFHSYAMRARLDQANGNHDNQIIWTSPIPFTGHPSFVENAFFLMDRWLAAMERDRRDEPLSTKVVDDKPAAAVDACWLAIRKVTDMALCRAAFPYFGDPRIAAGGPLADNVLKCQLKPMDRSDYNVVFTDDQWGRLQRVFSAGVCDYLKPSVGFGPTLPWLSFSKGPGGRQLPVPPSSLE